MSVFNHQYSLLALVAKPLVVLSEKTPLCITYNLD